MKVLESDKRGLYSKLKAKTFQVCKKKINNIIKRKTEYLVDYEKNVDFKRKRRRHVMGNKETN